MSFALSTSWNAFRFDDARPMLFEIKQMGFNEVELSFNLLPQMIKGMEAASREYSLSVKSLHNYCPIPQLIERKKALPDCFSMASADEKERQAAVKYAKISIDTAAQLQAKALVLHCGRVNVPDRMRMLIGLFEMAGNSSKEFLDLRDSIIEERKAQGKAFFENTLKSLEELNEYALQKNVALGIETRFYYREIPSFEEIGVILNSFKGSNIFYWHDTGHAEVMERLGFCKHKDLLDSYAASMIGIHLHDCLGCRDHLPPSYGEFDFTRLLPYLKKETIKVIEAHYPATSEEIMKGKAFLEQAFNEYA